MVNCLRKRLAFPGGKTEVDNQSIYCMEIAGAKDFISLRGEYFSGRTGSRHRFGRDQSRIKKARPGLKS